MAIEMTMKNPVRWLLRVPVPKSWIFVLVYLVGAALEHWVRLGPGVVVPAGGEPDGGRGAVRSGRGDWRLRD